MFKVGDIVRPKQPYVGYLYLFKIHKVLHNLNDNILRYKLQRDEQTLTAVYGPIALQINEISYVERVTWQENELELAGPKPDYPLEIKNKNLFDLKEKSFKGATIQGPFYQEATTYVPFDVKYYKDVNLDSLKINELSKILNEKEEKEMNILDLYEERKEKERRDNYHKEREKILKEDEIQSVIIEMENQVNTILENKNLKNRLKVNEEGLHTPETEQKLEELRLNTDKAKKKLRSTLDEIRALFEMTDSYEERIKILKNYGIVGDDGRINA